LRESLLLVEEEPNRFICLPPSVHSTTSKMDKLPTELIIGITGTLSASGIASDVALRIETLCLTDHLFTKYQHEQYRRLGQLATLVLTCKRIYQVVTPILYETPLLLSTKQATTYIRTFTGWITPFSLAKGEHRVFVKPRAVRSLSLFDARRIEHDLLFFPLSVVSSPSTSPTIGRIIYPIFDSTVTSATSHELRIFQSRAVGIALMLSHTFSLPFHPCASNYSPSLSARRWRKLPPKYTNLGFTLPTSLSLSSSKRFSTSVQSTPFASVRSLPPPRSSRLASTG